MRRQGLATRISLLSVGVAVLTALIAGALATGLIRSAATAPARRNLSRIADLVESTAEPSGVVTLRRLRRDALDDLTIKFGFVGADGVLVARNNSLVRRAVAPQDITAILAGKDVHAVRSVGGTPVFVEGRPTANGGIVLVQRQVDAVAAVSAAIRRLLLALIIAGAIAAVLGLLVAWQLARPLRRTAAAAHALADGRRDVTLRAEGPAEVVEVSESINTLAGALRTSEARQRQFLLSVSHDLRTPLTAITGYAESLADGVVPAGEIAHVGAVLGGEARRLERLVGDLLDLARLDAQDFRIEITPVELVALVRDAATVWAARCAGSSVEFRLETQPEQVWTHTDAARIRQVLDGLFDNALRVTPSGRPIVLAARAEAAGAAVEVRDGGPGLTDDDLAVAFQQGALYERYRGVRQVGTGLGLTIVQGLVSRVGGVIEAGHAREGGARFTVRLPAR